jgi:hypothetical protein
VAACCLARAVKAVDPDERRTPLSTMGERP